MVMEEVSALVESNSGWIEWKEYLDAYMSVRGHSVIPAIKSNIPIWCTPGDVFATKRRLDIDYSILKELKVPLFPRSVRREHKDELELLESLLEAFEDAVVEIERR